MIRAPVVQVKNIRNAVEQICNAVLNESEGSRQEIDRILCFYVGAK